MSGLPLRYVHQNMLVGHGEARAALFRVATVSYPFMAGADKREWLRRLARFAFAVEADFSLWRVCRAYPAERYVEQAEAMLDARRQGRRRGGPTWAGTRRICEAALVRARGLPRGVAGDRARVALGAGCCAAWTACAGGWRRCSVWPRCRRSRRRRSRR